MIRAIELANVRIFEGENWCIELKPLTVLCGANSAGKSTLLKVLLLLSQSKSQKVPGRLNFAGPRVDLGEYRSFVSHEEVERTVTLSVRVDWTVVSSTIDFLQSIKKPRKRSKSANDETIAKPAQLRATFSFSLPGSVTNGLRAKGSAHRTTDYASVMGVLDTAVFQFYVEDKELLQWKVMRSEVEEKSHDQYQILIPQAYFKRVGGFDLMSVEHDGEWVKAIALLAGLLPQAIVAKPKPSKGRKTEVEGGDPSAENFNNYPLPPFIQNALWAFDEALENIHYLGPLRAPAKRYYVASLGADPDLDPTGEFLPYVLRDRADQRVFNVPPGSPGDVVRQSLEEALDGWVGYLRSGDSGRARTATSNELVLNTTGQVLVQINVKSVSGAENHALADSGFGYSQVLPILVRGLLADQGSAFIVEQPELHLNPSLQVRLAEFFISMIRAGKQVLLETHSEHIVNAMRVLTAEDESGYMSDRARIYFIDTSSSRPVLINLSVQKDGTVPDWPRHFFGEAVELTGRLLRAQKRFRTSPSEMK